MSTIKTRNIDGVSYKLKLDLDTNQYEIYVGDNDVPTYTTTDLQTAEDEFSDLVSSANEGYKVSKKRNLKEDNTRQTILNDNYLFELAQHYAVAYDDIDMGVEEFLFAIDGMNYDLDTDYIYDIFSEIAEQERFGESKVNEREEKEVIYFRITDDNQLDEFLDNINFLKENPIEFWNDTLNAKEYIEYDYSDFFNYIDVEVKEYEDDFYTESIYGGTIEDGYVSIIVDLPIQKSRFEELKLFTKAHDINTVEENFGDKRNMKNRKASLVSRFKESLNEDINITGATPQLLCVQDGYVGDVWIESGQNFYAQGRNGDLVECVVEYTYEPIEIPVDQIRTSPKFTGAQNKAVFDASVQSPLVEKYISEDYNGYPDYDSWNISLWASNEEGIYYELQDILKSSSSREDFVNRAYEAIYSYFGGITPDNVEITKDKARYGLELEYDDYADYNGLESKGKNEDYDGYSDDTSWKVSLHVQNESGIYFKLQDMLKSGLSRDEFIRQGASVISDYFGGYIQEGDERITLSDSNTREVLEHLFDVYNEDWGNESKKPVMKSRKKIKEATPYFEKDGIKIESEVEYNLIHKVLKNNKNLFTNPNANFDLSNADAEFLDNNDYVEDDIADILDTYDSYEDWIKSWGLSDA